MKCYVEENFLYTLKNFHIRNIYYTMHSNVFVITFSKFHRKRETRDPIFLYSRIHLPLMDGLSVKYVIKKLFCFSFEFNENY